MKKLLSAVLFVLLLIGPARPTTLEARTGGEPIRSRLGACIWPNDPILRLVVHRTRRVHLGSWVLFSDLSGRVSESIDDPVITSATVAVPCELVRLVRTAVRRRIPVEWKYGKLDGLAEVADLITPFFQAAADRVGKPLHFLNPEMVLRMDLLGRSHALFIGRLLRARCERPRGCRAAGRIGGGDGHPGRVGAHADAAVLLFARPHGGHFAVCDGARTDVLRQRLHRQGRLLEVWPHLRADLLCRPPGDRVALAADG